MTLRGSVRRNRDHWIVTLFLVNGQEEPKKRKDQAWVFQPEIVVEGVGGAAVFCRKLARDKGGSKLDPRTREEIGAVADLLWFQTGGGKTEAYLGLTAFTLAMRRLQGDVKGRSGAHGVAVLMRGGLIPESGRKLLDALPRSEMVQVRGDAIAPK